MEKRVYNPATNEYGTIVDDWISEIPEVANLANADKYWLVQYDNDSQIYSVPRSKLEVV